MDFLEKVKSTFSSVAKVSSRESKKLYAITKLKLEITEKKGKEKILFKEIGMLAYKAHRKGKSITKRIRPKLEEIDALEDAIAILRNKVELIKNTDEYEFEEHAEDYEMTEDEEVSEEVSEEIAEEASEEETEESSEEVETEPIDPVE